MLEMPGAKQHRRKCPIWFSLVASEDWGGDVPLPQISACYLRIKNGDLPVSFIQKYLVKKLDLTSEAESIIEHGALPCLLNLLTHNHKKSIKKEACCTTSNITAGNKEQIQVLLKE